MIAQLPSGRLAVGSSTNGASHKVPGRVSDAAIAGKVNIFVTRLTYLI
jgi:isoaspartyl peptidase/L-asparaginase-like protein (Ntn-hydrolase superfamily)